MEKFEEYFQKADLDRDGRISGAEAVSFLMGSNLPKQVLAQIWMHADQNRTGFLARPEFYNALKLVTVAQSKRELTPEIVKAALYGPASSKIPAPQISTPTTPVPLPNSTASPRPQTSGMPQHTQNSGFRGLAPSLTNANQQFGAVPPTTGMKQQVQPQSSAAINPLCSQLQPTNTINQQFGLVQPTTSTIVNQQSGQIQSSSSSMNQHFKQTIPGTIMNQQHFSSQGTQMVRPLHSVPSGPASIPPQVASSSNISKGMTGMGFSNPNSSWLGGNIGAASTGSVTSVLDRGASPTVSPIASNSQNLLSTFSSPGVKDTKELVSSGNRSTTSPVFSSPQVPSAHKLTSSLPASSTVVPVMSNPQSLVNPDPFQALQSTLMKPSTGSRAVQTPTLPKPNQPDPASVMSSGLQPGAGNPTTEKSQISWPKMTRTGIQKYAKVFMEVDSDRDGKITGDQARNLFLSWRLPREILKQVWDLSDQDSDSMLSLREFSIALYLMERYREGHQLPSQLPSSVMLDETLLSLAGPPTAHGNTMWAPATGLRAQPGLPGAQTITAAGSRPLVPPNVSQPDGSIQFTKNASDPLSNNSNVNQLTNGDANSLDGKGLQAEETNHKVDDNEKLLLDSREKLEFYRKKMQDLVLFKSRRDNQLNEITERARADKTEAELLESKYKEKYQQVAEIHSKLTIEEASFREIQERKMELQQAIIRMEQCGSADGILQVRADRIQSDLEELLKTLADRCKKHSIEMKSSALIELPTGWHPGIPEMATIWDEDWDKFEDEGFSFDVAVPENKMPESVEKENSCPTRSFSPDSVSHAALSEKNFGGGTTAFDAESVYSADEPKSPQESPWNRTPESPSQEYPQIHFRKSFDEDAEARRSFDEPSWGNFDNNNDVDSVWGFNSKDSDHAKHEEKYFFSGASPERNDSPDRDNAFPKNDLFTFEDSVPSTQLSNTDNSPRYGDSSKDSFFDSFQHDSFSTRDSSSSHPDNLTRFDSISGSTRGLDYSSNFSFDDSDPFASSGPFKVSSNSPKEGSGKLNTF